MVNCHHTFLSAKKELSTSFYRKVSLKMAYPGELGRFMLLKALKVGEESSFHTLNSFTSYLRPGVFYPFYTLSSLSSHKAIFLEQHCFSPRITCHFLALTTNTPP